MELYMSRNSRIADEILEELFDEDFLDKIENILYLQNLCHLMLSNDKFNTN